MMIIKSSFVMPRTYLNTKNINNPPTKALRIAFSMLESEKLDMDAINSIVFVRMKNNASIRLLKRKNSISRIVTRGFDIN